MEASGTSGMKATVNGMESTSASRRLADWKRVVPLFYDRPNDNIPSEWVRMMKQSMKMAFTRFSSHRMVREYEERFYIPAIERGRELFADNCGEAAGLAAQRERLAKHWKHIALKKPEAHSDLAALQVGDFFKVSSRTRLSWSFISAFSIR